MIQPSYYNFCCAFDPPPRKKRRRDEDEEKRILKYMYTVQTNKMTSELHEYTLVCTNTLFDWNMEFS